MIKKLVLFGLCSCFVFGSGFAHPLPISSRTVENGGTLSAIDAYQDGVGAMIVQQGRGIDNSAMNYLVFKYGNIAKTNTLSVGDQVLLTGTPEDKLLAGKLFADGVTCNDGNSISTGETYLNGVCQGGTIPNGTICDDLNALTVSDVYTNNICAGVPSTLSTVDIFGDGSARALYKFENNSLDSSGNFNATPTSVTYSAGAYTNGIVLNGSTSKCISSLNIGTTTTSLSIWIKGSTNGSKNQRIIDSSSNNYAGMASMLLSTTGKLAIQRGNNASIETSVSGTINIGDNTWKHLVLVLDGNSVKTYVNNVLDINTVTSVTLGNDANFYIGTSSDFFNSFAGSIDQLRVFKRPITAIEVTTLFNEK